MEYRYSAKEWRIGEPKSKSGYRTIPLTEEAVAILKKQKEKNKRISEIKLAAEAFGQCNGPLNGPLAKISMLKSLEIKGFIGGNIKNEIRNRRITECRKEYII